MTISLRDRDKQGHVDLEALEFHMRSSMHSVGGKLLERLVNSDGGDYRGRTLHCEGGENPKILPSERAAGYLTMGIKHKESRS